MKEPIKIFDGEFVAKVENGDINPTA